MESKKYLKACRTVEVDGHNIAYKIIGRSQLITNWEIIRLYNSLGGNVCEPVDIHTERISGETDEDMVIRAFNNVRMNIGELRDRLND